jgi:hypothetical protein
MTKVTYEQVLSFRQNAALYKQRNAKRFSQFLYCLEKMTNKTKHIQEDYDDAAREINQDLCEKKDGFFVMEKYGKDDEQERFKLNAENSKIRDKKIRELLNKEVEIEPFILKNTNGELPKDINFEWWNVFAPFVLPVLTDELAEILSEDVK